MWFALSLLTAVSTSWQDILSKKAMKSLGVLAVAWAWPSASLPFLALALIQEGLPVIHPPFWGALALSVCVLVLATLLYCRAIHESDLSLTVPMLAWTPVFLLVTSPVMVKEYASRSTAGAVFVIAMGSYILHARQGNGGWGEPFRNWARHRGSRDMLIVAFLYSLGANCDKIGVMNSSPAFWLFALNACLAVIFSFWFFPRVSWGRLCQPGNRMLILGIGFFTAAAVYAQMHAIRLTLVSHVIAVKRLSTLFSLIGGFVFFREGCIRFRLTGGVLMLAGSVFLWLTAGG